MELIKIYDILNRRLIPDVSKIVINYINYVLVPDDHILVPKEVYVLNLEYVIDGENCGYTHVYKTKTYAINRAIEYATEHLDYPDELISQMKRGLVNDGFAELELDMYRSSGAWYTLKKKNINSIIKI
jgi:hypothetical protein